ncbi:hypothetical protein K1719_014235 [Acacia pycnantha]|nr:hypothetical protein K1719_014235 [Acacia pycnantha]
MEKNPSVIPDAFAEIASHYCFVVCDSTIRRLADLGVSDAEVCVIGPPYCWNELITLTTKYRDLTAQSQLAFTMSSCDSKRDSSQSSTPQSLIPQERPKLSIAHVTTASAPSIPKVVRPSLSFVSSPQLHDIAIRPLLPAQMHGLVVRPTLSPQLQSPRIESSYSLSPSPPPAQVPSPRIESLHPLTPQGAGGRLPPWGRDPVDGRIWIYPKEKTFNPVVCSVRQILLVIQGKFDYPCHSWKATPANYRKIWFEEWARKYKWLPEYEDDVKRIWNAKCSNILRGTMHGIRQDLFHKQQRPIEPLAKEELYTKGVVFLILSIRGGWLKIWEESLQSLNCSKRLIIMRKLENLRTIMWPQLMMNV